MMGKAERSFFPSTQAGKPVPRDKKGKKGSVPFSDTAPGDLPCTHDAAAWSLAGIFIFSLLAEPFAVGAARQNQHLYERVQENRRRQSGESIGYKH